MQSLSFRTEVILFEASSVSVPPGIRLCTEHEQYKASCRSSFLIRGVYSFDYLSIISEHRSDGNSGFGQIFEYDEIIHEVPDKGGAYVIFPCDIREVFGKGRW